jgi:hypothetical protein
MIELFSAYLVLGGAIVCLIVNSGFGNLILILGVCPYLFNEGHYIQMTDPMAMIL